MTSSTGASGSLKSGAPEKAMARRPCWVSIVSDASLFEVCRGSGVFMSAAALDGLRCLKASVTHKAASCALISPTIIILMLPGVYLLAI